MRYTDEVRIRFKGDKDLAAQFIPFGRALLGGVIRRGRELGNLNQSLIRRRFPGGLFIEAGYVGSLPYIDIDVSGLQIEETVSEYTGFLVSSFREALWFGRTDSDDIARHAFITRDGSAGGGWGVRGREFLQDTFASYTSDNAQLPGVIDYRHESGHVLWMPLRTYAGPYSLTYPYLPTTVWWHNTLLYTCPSGYSICGVGIYGGLLVVMEVLGTAADNVRTTANTAKNDVAVFTIPITLPTLVAGVFASPPSVDTGGKTEIYSLVQDRASYSVADSVYDVDVDGVPETPGVTTEPYPYTAPYGTLWFSFSQDGSKAIRCRCFCEDSAVGESTSSLSAEYDFAPPNELMVKDFARDSDIDRVIRVRSFRDEFFMDDGEGDPYREVTLLATDFQVVTRSVNTFRRYDKLSPGSVASYTRQDDRDTTITVTAGRQCIALDYTPDGEVTRLELSYAGGVFTATQTSAITYEAAPLFGGLSPVTTNIDRVTPPYDYTVSMVYVRGATEHGFDLFYTSGQQSRAFTNAGGVLDTLASDDTVMASSLLSNLSAADLREGVFVLTELRRKDVEEYVLPAGGGGETASSFSEEDRKDTLVVCREGSTQIVDVPLVTGPIAPLYHAEFDGPAYQAGDPSSLDQARLIHLNHPYGMNGTARLRPHRSDPTNVTEYAPWMGGLKAALGMNATLASTITTNGQYNPYRPLVICPRGGVIAVSDELVMFNVLSYDLYDDEAVVAPRTSRIWREFRLGSYLNTAVTPWRLCGQSAWIYKIATDEFFPVADVIEARSRVYAEDDVWILHTGRGGPDFNITPSFLLISGVFVYPPIYLNTGRFQYDGFSGV